MLYKLMSNNITHKLSLIFCAAFAACNASASANPFADIKAYDRSEHSRDVTECDRLAGHPSDPEGVTSGVTQEAMDKPRAIKACLAAIQKDSDNPRLNYQLARAYGYSGLHEDGDPYRVKALNAGYPQSLFVVGYIRLEGWDGSPADPCYGGELIRRSAKAGRFAGLVGFPHYVQTERFKGCQTYPVISKSEMREFLESAEGKADGYYQRILIKNLKKHLEEK